MSEENEFIQLVKSDQNFDALKDRIPDALDSLNTYYATVQKSHWSSTLTDTKQKILAAKLQLTVEKRLIEALRLEHGSAVQMSEEQLEAKEAALAEARRVREAAARASAEAEAGAAMAAEELATFRAKFEENKQAAQVEAARLHTSHDKAAQALEEAQRRLQASKDESQEKDAQIKLLQAEKDKMGADNGQLQARISELEEQKNGLEIENAAKLAGKEAELAKEKVENARLIEQATQKGTADCNVQLKEIFDVLDPTTRGGSRHKQTRRLRNYF